MRALRYLSTAIVVLAVVAGLIHLYLVIMMAVGPHGGPPPGAGGPPPGGGPLPQGAGAPASGGPPGGGPRGPIGGLMRMLPLLFGLNFVGFVALAGLFMLVRRAAVLYRMAVDVLLGLMAIATLVGWDMFGRNNPHHLGTIALIVELALLVAVVIHGFIVGRTPAYGIAPRGGALTNGRSDAFPSGRGAGRTPSRSGQ